MAVVKQSTFSIVADYSSAELTFECRFWSRGPKWPGGCGEAVLFPKAADYSSIAMAFECRFWSRGSQLARRPHWIRMGVVGLCNGNGCRASQQAVAVSWASGRCGLGGCDEAIHFSHRSGLLWLAPSLLELGPKWPRGRSGSAWAWSGFVTALAAVPPSLQRLRAGPSEGVVSAAVMRPSLFTA